MKITNARFVRRASAPAFSSGAMTLVAFAVALVSTAVLLAVGVDTSGSATLLMSASRSLSARTGSGRRPLALTTEPSSDAMGTGARVEGAATDVAEPNSATVQYFDGRPVRPVRTIRMKVTAYSPDTQSCAPFDDGITASGYSVYTNGGKLIAADRQYRFGTLMSVPGYNGNRPTPVLDRGAAIKGNRLDLLFPTHGQAMQWGRQDLLVTIWEYIDEQ